MNNQVNAITLSTEDATQKNHSHQPITTQRKIVIEKLHLNITSVFMGEQTFSDKLFLIANRKIKGSILLSRFPTASMFVIVVLAILALIIQFLCN